MARCPEEDTGCASVLDERKYKCLAGAEGKH